LPKNIKEDSKDQIPSPTMETFKSEHSSI